MKTYGIYLAYPPTIELRAQGLGRYLSEFLKAADRRDDVKFVVACPSWMVSSLLAFLEAANVPSRKFEVVSPGKIPLLLRAHEFLAGFRARPRRRRLQSLFSQVRNVGEKLTAAIERRIASARSVAWTSVLGVVLIPIVAVVVVLVGLSMLLLTAILGMSKRVNAWVAGMSAVKKIRASLEGAVLLPKDDLRIARLYRLMLEAESSMLQKLMENRSDVAAWYCPTAFWPRFHEIRAPRLMCVPDVVIGDFPAGFANIGGDRYLESFRQVEKAISAGTHFITYSEDVKWRTLVRRYGIDPQAITVVPHGANRLLDLIQVSGSPDNQAATAALCRNLFATAVAKAVSNSYATFFKRSTVQFIVYPSQFRPNKNVISLLRAYEYLLRRRFVGHKLVLTGNPTLRPEVGQFIAQHNLENDVLCLYDLSDQELAACYRLADLAVNPSLSEGGFPFTFTEALSLGTPVVMARMPATEEVIIETQLRDAMLFDPYDWKDIADRIEWGLDHKEELLELQLPVYEKLAKRTWRLVVDEHIDILARIADPHDSSGSPHDQGDSERSRPAPYESRPLVSDRRASA